MSGKCWMNVLTVNIYNFNECLLYLSIFIKPFLCALCISRLLADYLILIIIPSDISPFYR